MDLAAFIRHYTLPQVGLNFSVHLSTIVSLTQTSSHKLVLHRIEGTYSTESRRGWLLPNNQSIGAAFPTTVVKAPCCNNNCRTWSVYRDIRLTATNPHNPSRFTFVASPRRRHRVRVCAQPIPDWCSLLGTFIRFLTGWIGFDVCCDLHFNRIKALIVTGPWFLHRNAQSNQCQSVWRLYKTNVPWIWSSM